MTNSDFDHNLVVHEPPSFFTDIVQAEPNEALSFFDRFDNGFKYYYTLMVLSYFNGSDLLHVFGRLSKKIREDLPKSGLLD
jgi:hypothetical protein